MTKLKAWLNLFLIFCFVFCLTESTPSLLSSVKARNRLQQKSVAKTLNWASPHATSSSSWNQMSSPYSSSYYSPYQQQQQQQQQQYLMAPPPPPISPYSLSANDQSSSKFKTKALKLVGPTVQKYFDEHQLGIGNPMMRQKKRKEAMERAFPELSSQEPLLDENELTEPVDYEIQTGLKAGGNGIQPGSNNNNKTGLNIHRFRPGKWTNIFSGRRNNFKLAESDDASSNTTSALNDDKIAQIDLIKTSTTATSSSSVNSTTTVAKFRPGARRRYGYKNFKQIQSNETMSVNDTQLRSGVKGMFYRNLKGNRNMNDSMIDDLIDGNANRTVRRPFGSRLYEKQLFRSYIQKKKLIQLLQNETETGLAIQPAKDLISIDLIGSEPQILNSTPFNSIDSSTQLTTTVSTSTSTSYSSSTSSKASTELSQSKSLDQKDEIDQLLTSTHRPKKFKLRKLSVKLPKLDSENLNPRDSAVALIASQPDAFDSRYSDLPHLIKRVSDNQNRIASIYNKSKLQ